MEYQSVSLQQMKEALGSVAGSKFPVTITTAGGEITVRYIRGFADPQNNVVLVSATSYSLAVNILEVKEILTMEYSPEHAGGSLRAFRAKWLGKPQKYRLISLYLPL